MGEGDRLILVIIIIILGSFLGLSILGSFLDGDSFNSSKYVPVNSGPIPDLGVNKTQATEFEKASAKIRVAKTQKMLQNPRKDYLTSEELKQNIEDVEMRGMGDDPLTLEDLRDELK